MKKIQCWIPLATWEKIELMGYKSPTVAVTKAFECFLEDQAGSPNIKELVDISKEQKARIEDLNMKVQTLFTELENVDEQVEKLDIYVNKRFVYIQNVMLEAFVVKKTKWAWWKILAIMGFCSGEILLFITLV